MKLEGNVLGYNKKILFFGTIILLTASAFFYAGAKYEKHKLKAHGLLLETSKNQNLISFRGFLTAKDETSFTLKMDDGTEKNFPFEKTATFGPRGKGAPQDFYIGHLLVISGENDPEGAFIVQNIRKSRKSPKIAPPLEKENTGAALQQ